MGKHARYDVRSDAPGLRVGMFTFVTNNTSDPTVWDDDNTGIVSAIGYAATGVYTVTLSDTFSKVKAMASCQDFANHQATVTSTTTSTIVVQQSDHADPQAAETSTGDTITVFYCCRH